MSKRLEVLVAVKAMLTTALPGVDVQGLDGADAAPERIGGNGRAYIEAGDPGRPEIDLCPVTYYYQHQIPITLDAPARGNLSAEQAVDAMTDQIAAAIVSDRFLGGLVDYLDASAPPANDDYTAGSAIIGSASVVITASYSTPHPL